MTSHPYAAWLDDYADGLLSPDEAHELEQHLTSCAACRAELAELAELLELARTLPQEIWPARDLWTGIEARLDRHRTRGFFRSRLLWVAVALIALGSGVWLQSPERPALVLERSPLDWEPGLREATDVLAEALEARRDHLDPDTIRVIEENLAVIDQAIRDCEAALGDKPAHPRLERALQVTLLRKIDLLKLAANLPNKI